MSLQAQLAPIIRARAVQKVNIARIRIEQNLDNRVPTKTGALAKSRRTRVSPGSQVIALQIEYPTNVAIYTDVGTKAHVIRAREGYLRFSVAGAPARLFGRAGKVLYRKQVNWRPGLGVAKNKRWFRGAVTLTAWRQALK